MYIYVQVALKIAHSNGVLTYGLHTSSKIGDLIGRRVSVTLRKRIATGVIIGEDTKPNPEFKYKDILNIIDQKPIITKYQLELMRFCANYYFNDLGMCVHLAVPKNEKKTRMPAKAIIKTPQILQLTPEQEKACSVILSRQERAFLLEGVTGSGKTLVYIEVARALLAEAKSVLFLVPEISLTPQLVSRVEGALGIKALLMHSNISPAQKRDTIMDLLSDHPKVLIGARSAIFAPLKNLGAIIVDEEHDASLKQDESPRYHARDLALWRAKNEVALVILGSATPSLESVYNVQKHKLHHLSLKQRFNHDQSLPIIELIDLKKRQHDVAYRTEDQSLSLGQQMCILSKPLVDEMRLALAKQSQILLFLNQRGYAKFGICNHCGKMVNCPNCSVSLTYYQKRNALVCHQCRHAQAAQINCQHCHKPEVRYLGLGTERLEEEVRAIFTEAIIMRLDRDVVRSQKRLEHTLSAMHENRAQILIGTQMIAKGHDFQNVALVGVVCADVALSMPDFRAAEKTFQLLTQVAGRAGRGKIAGKAIIQAFDPEHPSIKLAQTHDVEKFVKLELRARKLFFEPPYSRAALIKSEHEDQALAQKNIEIAFALLKKDNNLKILGPAVSPIEKINKRYRFQCLVMAKDARSLHQGLLLLKNDEYLAKLTRSPKARFIIDVDPQNL